MGQYLHSSPGICVSWPQKNRVTCAILHGAVAPTHSPNRTTRSQIGETRSLIRLITKQIASMQCCAACLACPRARVRHPPPPFAAQRSIGSNALHYLLLLVNGIGDTYPCGDGDVARPKTPCSGSHVLPTTPSCKRTCPSRRCASQYASLIAFHGIAWVQQELIIHSMHMNARQETRASCHTHQVTPRSPHDDCENQASDKHLRRPTTSYHPNA